MSMHGSCRCKNIAVEWQTVDYSVVPRQCQCEYCKAKSAAYVSKSGSSFRIRIHRESLHLVVTHGSESAKFHECRNCGDVVCVTADIDGETYGALNSRCLKNKLGFSPAIESDVGSQTVSQKMEGWRQNWCHPVHITRQGGKGPSAEDAVTGAPA